MTEDRSAETLQGLRDRGAPDQTDSRFRPPKQDRSRLTLDRIATAALEMMEEVGVEGATVAAIVNRAGASVGSFYARFPGKEDLIRYLQDRVWTDARERWDQALAAEAWEGLPMTSVVEGVVGLLLRSLKADYQRRRALGWNRAMDPTGAELALSFHDHLLSTVTSLLLARRGEISHPDPEAAIPFGYRAVVGAIREFLSMEEARALAPDKVGVLLQGDDLGRELARLWNGYLDPSTRSGLEAGKGDVDFFDPWG
jgi:AcrR family transcriptional regulator